VRGTDMDHASLGNPVKELDPRAVQVQLAAFNHCSMKGETSTAIGTSRACQYRCQPARNVPYMCKYSIFRKYYQTPVYSVQILVEVHLPRCLQQASREDFVYGDLLPPSASRRLNTNDCGSTKLYLSLMLEQWLPLCTPIELTPAVRGRLAPAN
jgi:hypothetical protein